MPATIERAAIIPPGWPPLKNSKRAVLESFENKTEFSTSKRAPRFPADREIRTIFSYMVEFVKLFMFFYKNYNNPKK